MTYEIGHIYAIWDCEDHNLIYYGSTNMIFEERMKRHKARNNDCSSKQVIERGNYEYAILESYENIDEYDLVERERWYILNKVCVNKNIPHRTKAEYYQDNKEKFAKQSKEYRQNNKEKFAEYYQENKEKLAEYYQDNKEKIAEYRQDNKEKIAEQRKEHYQNNKEKFAERNKEYRQNNKEKIKELQKQNYEQNRDKILQKQKQNIRCPHCDKELRKGSLLKHIKKYCKGQNHSSTLT
tara:strand:- start:549 stop:1262 length:714 start_codon:yes stop_codon:yes gene_type:complete